MYCQVCFTLELERKLGYMSCILQERGVKLTNTASQQYSWGSSSRNPRVTPSFYCLLD